MGSESREEREQLKALSKEIFGVESRYRKLYETKELMTRKVSEVVPGENGEPDKTEIKEVPVLFNGTKQWTIKRRTTEEVIQLLLEFKGKRDEYIANMKKAQAEAEEKKKADDLAKKVQEDLGGSALT